HESKDRGIAGANLLERKRSPFVRESLRQRLRRELFHNFDRLPLAVALRGGTVELCGRIEVVARHAVRPGERAARGESAEWHCLAIAVAHTDFQDVTAIAAVFATGLCHDAVDATEQVEVIHIRRTEKYLQRREHIRHVDPK